MPVKKDTTIADAPVGSVETTEPTKEDEVVVETSEPKTTAVAAPASPTPPAKNGSSGLPALKIDLTLSQMGEVFAASGFFDDARSKAQAIVKILAGAEQGISPIAAMQSINVIKGKISYSGNLIAALIRRHEGYDYRTLRSDAEGAEIEFLRLVGGKWRIEGTFGFGPVQAQALGLSNQDNYKKQPATMYWNRAMTGGARMNCPDIFIGGVYTAEELGADEDDEGRVIDTTYTPVAVGNTGEGTYGALPTQTTAPASGTSPQGPSQGPVCSLGVPMVLRTRKDGSGQFWSCPHQVDGKYHGEIVNVEDWAARQAQAPKAAVGGSDTASDGDLAMAAFMAQVKAVGGTGQTVRAVVSDAYTPAGAIAGQPVSQTEWRDALVKLKADHKITLRQVLASVVAEVAKPPAPNLIQRLAEPVVVPGLGDKLAAHVNPDYRPTESFVSDDLRTPEQVAEDEQQELSYSPLVSQALDAGAVFVETETVPQTEQDIISSEESM